jgi:hypothetical protein
MMRLTGYSPGSRRTLKQASRSFICCVCHFASRHYPDHSNETPVDAAVKADDAEFLSVLFGLKKAAQWINKEFAAIYAFTSVSPMLMPASCVA